MKKAKLRRPGDIRHVADKGWEKFWFYFVQWTWGLPVNAVGGLVYLILKTKFRHERFCNAWITYIPGNWGGLSLGLFIFMAEGREEGWTKNTQIHEYGHTIQCLLLGPLYWFVVAIPSAFWCNCMAKWRQKNNVSYYKLYCESWANNWGQKWSRRKQYGIK
ncbi:MAG: hypothetical protein IKM24_11190 [Clostridia bacterium]|nr:hypothetical protein [Clostridia bacterium]MBR6781563.1 hypothetical protein [Clostridia bacterium]